MGSRPKTTLLVRQCASAPDADEMPRQIRVYRRPIARIKYQLAHRYGQSAQAGRDLRCSLQPTQFKYDTVCIFEARDSCLSCDRNSNTTLVYVPTMSDTLHR
jgi:hypothetical protein